MNPAQRKQDPSLNYRVNLFVDNSNTEGAPVIMDSNYSYHNIFGTLEYENYYGSLKTDHTMLKPGLLQQAMVVTSFSKQKIYYKIISAMKH